MNTFSGLRFTIGRKPPDFFGITKSKQTKPSSSLFEISTMAFLSSNSFTSLSQTLAISSDMANGHGSLVCFGVSTKSSFISSDTLSRTQQTSVIISQILAKCNKRPPTLSDTRVLRTIWMRAERGKERYLLPPRAQALAPGGRPIPTPPLCLPSTKNWANASLLGRNTRGDGPGCPTTFFLPALALARAADELASVASWDASFSIVSKNLSVKRSSAASFPGAKASEFDKMKS